MVAKDKTLLKMEEINNKADNELSETKKSYSGIPEAAFVVIYFNNIPN